ncbi:MAG: DUF433 domain-containing protein [Nitrospira sp.]
MRYESISIDPQVCSGKPCIRGTQIMVTNILGLIAGGYSNEQILQTYPELTREDLAAALDYVSQVVDEDKVIPVPDALAVLLDQNIPRAVAAWLRIQRPERLMTWQQ